MCSNMINDSIMEYVRNSSFNCRFNTCVLPLSGNCVIPCGLFVRPDYSYLAATPDGLVGDNAIVEVKCPYTGINSMIKPSPMFPCLEMRDTDLCLKKSHSYYDQVHGQLFITKRSTCIFIVYTKVDLRTIHVDLDIEYGKTCRILKQKLFYEKFFLEYITQFAL